MKKPAFDLKALEKLTGLEKEKALDALGLLEGFQENNPLYYYNHPVLSEKQVHTKQMQFHAMPYRERYFFGGNQSGKTTAGLADDVIQVIDREEVPEHLLAFKRYDPPCYVRILTTDLTTMELTLYSKLRQLLPRHQLKGNGWDRAFNGELRVLRFTNGSMMQFMTYKQDVQTMGGATLHRVHFDEEPPRDVWEENNLRVMREGGDLITTMTPLQGLTWTYDEVWERTVIDQNIVDKDIWESEEENIGIVLVDMDDNPYLSHDDKYQTLKNYPPEVIEARKRGKFIHFAGLIYPEFNKESVVQRDYDFIKVNPDTNREVINPHMNVVVSIDPGIRHRCAVLWGALDGEDNLTIFEELYEQGATVGEVADKIKKLNAKWDIKPIYYVIDPAARNKNMQTGRSDQMEFADHGIITIAGQHDVEPGINRVKERIRNDKLFILERCSNVITEFLKYRWKDSPRSGEDGRPVPVKSADHAMDALRYLVMSRPYLPEEIKPDNETAQQRMMRLDRERVSNPNPRHEFGGVYN